METMARIRSRALMVGMGVFTGLGLVGASRANGVPAAPVLNGPTTVQAGSYEQWGMNATDPDGDQVQYTINWGDGTVQTPTPFVASGIVNWFFHQYLLSGVYNIVATATDTAGNTSPASAGYPVTVNGPNPVATLELSASPSTIRPRNFSTITAIARDTNGQVIPGYANVTYSVVSGGGSVNPSSGVSTSYKAPGQETVATIQGVSQNGKVGTVPVTVQR